MSRPKGLPRTGGRLKGTPNKATRDLKEAILNAFSRVGGEDYLVKLASTDPRTFAMLVAKILPNTTTADIQAKMELICSWIKEPVK